MTTPTPSPSIRDHLDGAPIVAARLRGRAAIVAHVRGTTDDDVRLRPLGEHRKSLRVPWSDILAVDRMHVHTYETYRAIADHQRLAAGRVSAGDDVVGAWLFDGPEGWS